MGLLRLGGTAGERAEVGGLDGTDRRLVYEEPLPLVEPDWFPNGQEIVSLMCSPVDLEALGAGFLYNEGLIDSVDDIELVEQSNEGTCVDVWLRKAVSLDPDSPWARMDLAMFVFRARRYDEAATLFEIEYRRELFRWAAEQVRNQVSQQQWMVFWMTSVEARPVAEVAAETQMSIGNIYVARSRITKRIRTMIQQYEGQIS